MRVIRIPNALPDHLLRAVQAVWPDESWQYWHRYTGKTADKYGSMDRCRIPVAVQAALDHLAAVCGSRLPDGVFIDYDLHAAGMHMIPPGGFLGRHLDAEYHPIRPWKREWSIVCNVNQFWAESEGGFLLIDGEEPIVPEPGTAVMFTTPGTWHEVSKTDIFAPARKTLALFGWSICDEKTGQTSANFAERM